MSERLPKNWIRVRVSTLCSIRTGIAFSTKDVIEKDEPGAIACFRTSNIQEELETNDVTYIPDRLVKDRDYSLRVGDILMSTANSNTLVGKCCLIRHLDEDSLFGGFISRVRIESDLLDPEFAYLWLSSSPVQSHLRQRARQTTNIANLPPGDVLSTPILLPPLSEQRRIVEILNEARVIRRLRQQADQLTTQLIPAIFEEMFGQLDRTEYRPLSRFFEQPPQNGLYKPAESYGNGTRIVRIGDFYGGKIVDVELLQRLDLTEKELRKYALQSNDILINRVNSIEYLGKSALVPEMSEPAVFESNMMRFSLDTSTLLPEFLIAYLQTPLALHELRRRAKHAINQASINQGDVGSLPVPVPSLGTQRRFIELAQVSQSVSVEHLRGSATESDLRQSLLAYAFSGELTAEWRESYREQLTQEATERDEWLRENGVKLSIPDLRMLDRLDDNDGRLAELNREQRKLLEQIQNLDPNENGGTFTLSSLVSSLDEPLDSLPVDAVRRHLDVLAARGLIKAISRRAGAGGSVNVAFGNLYRQPLKEDQIIGTADESDFQKLSELDRLSRQGRAISISVSDSLALSDTLTASVERLKAGQRAPTSGLYQEVDPLGEPGKTVVIEKGKILPPTTIEDGGYVWKGDE